MTDEFMIISGPGLMDVKDNAGCVMGVFVKWKNMLLIFRTPDIFTIIDYMIFGKNETF